MERSTKLEPKEASSKLCIASPSRAWDIIKPSGPLPIDSVGSSGWSCTRESGTKNGAQRSAKRASKPALRESSDNSEASAIGSKHRILNQAKHKRSDFRHCSAHTEVAAAE